MLLVREAGDTHWELEATENDKGERIVRRKWIFSFNLEIDKGCFQADTKLLKQLTYRIGCWKGLALRCEQGTGN